MEAGRLVSPADLNEIILGIGLQTLRVERVVVMDDGADGSSAVIRAVGTLQTIPFLGDFPGADGLVSTDYTDVDAALDWVLEPEAEHVDVFLHFVNRNDRERALPLVLHAFFQESRMPSYAPGRGFDTGMGVHRWVGFVEDGATSYAWESADGGIEHFFSISGFAGFQSEVTVLIPACESHRRLHARLHVGGPGIDGLLQAIARTETTAQREITGTVLDGAGMPAEGARVHAESDTNGYLTRATTDATGAFTLHVPNGAVSLRAYRRGEGLSDTVVVPTTTATAMLQLPPSGFVHVIATEPPPMGMPDPPTPIPVRVQVIPETPLEALPEHWGEEILDDGRLHLEFPISGEITLRLPVGRHTVVVSRGYEYEMVAPEVTIVAGETVEAPVSLSRVVDTRGVICGDFHIHTTRSGDSGDDARLKIRAAVGEGLEIPVRTDHEFVADFAPVVAELDVGDWAFGMAGEELTSFSWGHMGVFPLVPDPLLPNGGAIPWTGRTPPEVFETVRARAEDPLLIINHPRNPSFSDIEAYFSAAGFDPITGMVERMEYWDEDFSLVEVFNDDTFMDKQSVVDDWFALLRQGRRVYAVGSSDSHFVNGSPIGYPRTCLRVATDNPRSLTSSIVRDAAGAGRSTISGGIYVDTSVTSGMFGPGDEIPGSGLNARFTVTVQAASWVDVDRVRVFVDGVETETVGLAGMPIPDPLNPVLRFQDSFEVEVGMMGTWVLAVAEGDESLEPVHPGRRPFGVTNPMFFRR
jgi:hypothetical protein